jgi:hypothetical protein
LRHWIQLHGTAAAALPAPRPALLPVAVVTQPAPEPPSRLPSAAIEIEVVGTIVRVHDGAAATTLRMVLACLRGAAP